MGMSASQVRLLTLISRQHDIGRRLQHYSQEKQSLAREMQKISKEYNAALQNKVLKWSNNGGVDYVDLTYSTLMRPTSANSYSPVLLTNLAGKVILDSKYKKYAEMISPDGKATRDWESNSNRCAILASLTGIPQETIERAAEGKKNVQTSHDYLESIRDERDEVENDAVEKMSAAKFAKTWGNVGGYDFGSNNSKETITLGKSVVNRNYSVGFMKADESLLQGFIANMQLENGKTSEASTTLRSCLDSIVANVTGQGLLTESDAALFKTACDDFYNTYSSFITNYYLEEEEGSTKKTVDSGTTPIGISNDTFELNVPEFIEAVLTCYKEEGGSNIVEKNNDVNYIIIKDADQYSRYLELCSEAENAEQNYSTVVDTDNQILNSEQERLIDFYDQLFTAICENGWVADFNVSEIEYLNQMFQNNEFFVTSMTENINEEEIDADSNKKDYINKYVYNTDLWSDTEQIYAVNDENLRQEAQVEYEHEKSIVNSKESKVDEQMKNLETEQNAVKQMMEGIKQVRDKNVERNFSIFT